VEATTAKPTKRKFALLAVSSESDSEHEEDSVENSVYRYRAEPTNIGLGDLHAFSVAKVCLEFGPGIFSRDPETGPGYVPKATPFREQVVNLQALPPEKTDPALTLLLLRHCSVPQTSSLIVGS